MTHTTTDVDRESGGSVVSVYATIDITSLDGANTEPFDTEAELKVGPLGVSVQGVENAASYTVAYDHVAGDLVVKGQDGTDPTAGTDVGEVRVRVDGDVGP